MYNMLRVRDRNFMWLKYVNLMSNYPYHLKYLSSFRKPNYLYIFCNSMPSENRLLKKATFGVFRQSKKNLYKKNIRINPNIIKFKLLMTSTSKIELQKIY
jgi:hypothetical protein